MPLSLLSESKPRLVGVPSPRGGASLWIQGQIASYLSPGIGFFGFKGVVRRMSIISLSTKFLRPGIMYGMELATVPDQSSPGRSGRARHIQHSICSALAQDDFCRYKLLLQSAPCITTTNPAESASPSSQLNWLTQPVTLLILVSVPILLPQGSSVVNCAS